MSDRTGIEWTEATWNPVTGCSKVSPGCAHCYAERIELRFGRSRLPWTPENAAENVRLHPDRLDQPLRWRRPRMIFVCSMSDLFHEQVPDHYIAGVFAIMSEASRHTFQVLTKRPERARDFFAAQPKWRLPANVWIGVSIENARYTWRADVLREIPAAVRFISAEPLLGSLFAGPSKGDYGRAIDDQATTEDEALEILVRRAPLDLTGIDWLIVGGESGPHARPMRSEWARELRDTCLAVCGDCLTEDDYPLEEQTVPRCGRPALFFKQWGEYAPVVGHLDGPSGLHVVHADGTHEPWYGRQHGSITVWGREAITSCGDPIVRKVGKKTAGRLLDGREWNEMPLRRPIAA